MRSAFECNEPSILQWHALYVKSRHEKTVAMEFARRGVSHLLPLRRVRRRWSDRSKLIEVPLFPSYVFVNISSKQISPILDVPGVVCFVGPRAFEPAQINASEISQLEKLMNCENSVDPYPYLKVGQKVRVRTGVLRGCEGFLVRKNRSFQLVISIHLMMRSVAVELDGADIEVIT